MPIQFDITEQGRLWVITVTHPWSVSEFMATYPRMKQELDSVTWKVHMLLDFTAAGTWTGNALQARHAPYNTHPNRGTAAVILGNAPALKAVIDVMIRVSHIGHVHFFTTAAQGLEFLKPYIQDALNSQPAPDTEHFSQ